MTPLDSGKRAPPLPCALYLALHWLSSSQVPPVVQRASGARGHPALELPQILLDQALGTMDPRIPCQWEGGGLQDGVE